MNTQVMKVLHHQRREGPHLIRGPPQHMGIRPHGKAVNITREIMPKDFCDALHMLAFSPGARRSIINLLLHVDEADVAHPLRVVLDIGQRAARFLRRFEAVRIPLVDGRVGGRRVDVLHREETSLSSR
jgi:hypothetical protein